jgi:hypothetical protein
MKVVFILVLIALPFRLAAQINSEKAMYAMKVEKFNRMKTTGTVMIVAGGILTALGISKIAENPYTSSTYSNGSQSSTTINQAGVEGQLLFLGGAGLLGGGIPLAIIGSKKSKQYQRKFDALSLHLNFSDPQQQGLALSYKF